VSVNILDETLYAPGVQKSRVQVRVGVCVYACVCGGVFGVLMASSHPAGRGGGRCGQAAPAEGRERAHGSGLWCRLSQRHRLAFSKLGSSSKHSAACSITEWGAQLVRGLPLLLLVRLSACYHSSSPHASLLPCVHNSNRPSLQYVHHLGVQSATATDSMFAA
jgi:hypothetical protein